MLIAELVVVALLLLAALRTTGRTAETARRIKISLGVLIACDLPSVGLAMAVGEPLVYERVIVLLNLPVRAGLLIWLSGSSRSWIALIGVSAAIFLATLQIVGLVEYFTVNATVAEQTGFGMFMLALVAITAYVLPLRLDVGAAQVMVLSILLALGSTWVEYGMRALRQWLLGPMVVVTMVDNLGYSPLLLPWINLLIFTVLGLLGAIIVSSMRSPRVGASVVFALIYLAWFNGLAPAMSIIHWLAMCLLVLGISVTSINSIIKRRERFFARAGRRTGLLASATAVVLAGLYVGPNWSESRQLASLPAPDENSPNVLLITLDTVRLQSMSLYGYERNTTPELEQLAARGTVFEESLTTSAWTLPTHASLFTGRYGCEHGADWLVALDDRYPTLAELLGQHGYATAGFVGNRWMCGPNTGLNRGFAWYDYRPPWWKQAPLGSFLARLALTAVAPIPRKNAADLNREFLAWLDDRPPRPFLAFLNYFDAHDPYVVPEAQFDRFSDLPPAERDRIRRTWFPAPPDGWTAQNELQAQVALDTYDGAIAYLDHQVGRLFDELEERGLLENTLVIITNDHGEHFGEHGLYQHGNSLYRQLIDAPLLILGPRAVPAGQRIAGVASLADVPSTMFDLLGLPQPPELPGTTLARFWDEARFPDIDPVQPTLIETGRVFLPDQPNSNGPIRSVVADGWHYIRYDGLDAEELFDFENDPLETTDLSQTEAGQAQLPRLRRLLEELQDQPRDDLQALPPEGEDAVVERDAGESSQPE